MKKSLLPVGAALVAATLGLFAWQLKGAGPGGLQRYEYATIRWSGRENTHLIRSSGKVEMLGSILNRTPRPDRVDERAYYMNIAMNAVAKEGFEFAGMTPDEIVMRREIQ